MPLTPSLAFQDILLLVGTEPGQLNSWQQCRTGATWPWAKRRATHCPSQSHLLLLGALLSHGVQYSDSLQATENNQTVYIHPAFQFLQEEPLPAMEADWSHKHRAHGPSDKTTATLLPVLQSPGSGRGFASCSAYKGQRSCSASAEDFQKSAAGGLASPGC